MLRKIGKLGMYQREVTGTGSNQGLTAQNGCRIAIKRDHIGTSSKDRRRIAARTKRTIENDFSWSKIQTGENLGEKNRNVTDRSAFGISQPCALIRHHSASPL